jgi:hypothetical protein
MGYCGKYGRAAGHRYNTAHELCFLGDYVTDTQSEYTILIVFQRQWSGERAQMLGLYVRCLPCYLLLLYCIGTCIATGRSLVKGILLHIYKDTAQHNLFLKFDKAIDEEEEEKEDYSFIYQGMKITTFPYTSLVLNKIKFEFV